MILLMCRPIFAQTYPSPLLSQGGVDTHVYKSDTVLLEATAFEDGDNTMTGRSFNVGLSMLHSPYLSILYVPISYGLNDNFSILMSLPFLTKTIVYQDTHHVKSGYGDTMLGVNFSTGLFDVLTTSTTARITLPTGNVNSQDLNYDIPMGYGAYTLSLQEILSCSDNVYAPNPTGIS